MFRELPSILKGMIEKTPLEARKSELNIFGSFVFYLCVCLYTKENVNIGIYILWVGWQLLMTMHLFVQRFNKYLMRENKNRPSKAKKRSFSKVSGEVWGWQLSLCKLENLAAIFHHRFLSESVEMLGKNSIVVLL